MFVISRLNRLVRVFINSTNIFQNVHAVNILCQTLRMENWTERERLRLKKDPFPHGIFCQEREICNTLNIIKQFYK